MAPFSFKSGNHFVASSDGTTLQVYELTEPTLPPSSIQKTHWKEVATIDFAEGATSKTPPSSSSYDGLLFFDGMGRVTKREALTDLAQDLKQLYLLVNPEGWCFQEASHLGTYANCGIDYLRLNDLFSWPRHGVELMMSGDVWERLEIKYHPPYHTNPPSNPEGGGVVSKEKYEELKRKLKEKEDEIEKFFRLMAAYEEMNVAKDAELEKLKTSEEGLQKAVTEAQKNSWTVLPSTKFLPPRLEAREKYLASRQRAPPRIFYRGRQQLPKPYNNVPKLAEDTTAWELASRVRLVDEENSSTIEWPSLVSDTTLRVWTGKGEDTDFDMNDWWVVKSTHPGGGLTMLVYYEGTLSEKSWNGQTIPWPFPEGATALSEGKLLLYDLHPFGVRLGFMCRK